MRQARSKHQASHSSHAQLSAQSRRPMDGGLNNKSLLRCPPQNTGLPFGALSTSPGEEEGGEAGGGEMGKAAGSGAITRGGVAAAVYAMSQPTMWRVSRGSDVPYVRRQQKPPSAVCTCASLGVISSSHIPTLRMADHI